MASLEEQQPKQVRARTQQLQRKQERSALAGSALGGHAAGRTLRAWLRVWRCERSEVVRIDGLEDWVRRRQHHPARGSGRSGKPAEQSGQGCSGLGRGGALSLAHGQAEHTPSCPPPGEHRGLSAHGIYFWVFVPVTFPVKHPACLPGGESDPVPQGGNVTPGSLILS